MYPHVHRLVKPQKKKTLEIHSLPIERVLFVLFVPAITTTKYIDTIPCQPMIQKYFTKSYSSRGLAHTHIGFVPENSQRKCKDMTG